MISDAKLAERACNFFKIDKNKLEELAKNKDLYSAISELSGISRDKIKQRMHGFAYEVRSMKRCLACDIPLISETESLCPKCRSINEVDHCEECNTKLDKGYKISFFGRILCECCFLDAAEELSV